MHFLDCSVVLRALCGETCLFAPCRFEYDLGRRSQAARQDAPHRDPTMYSSPDFEQIFWDIATQTPMALALLGTGLFLLAKRHKAPRPCTIAAVTFLGLSQTYQYVFQGALIVVSALVYSIVRRRAAA